MSKITITRTNEWSNRLRSYTLFLDGQKLGTIANDEIKSFEVPPGKHTLKATINWLSSREQEFTIEGSEAKYFRVSAFKLAKILTPVLFILAIGHLALRKIMHFDYLIWLAIPVLVILVYYLTLGRKDYLWLRQTETW
jgi:hypothetical protein